MPMPESEETERTQYLVERSRSGRFKFTLLTPNGRLAGVVTVSVDGRPRTEIEAEANRKIRALAGAMLSVAGPAEAGPSDAPV